MIDVTSSAYDEQLTMAPQTTRIFDLHGVGLIANELGENFIAEQGTSRS